MWAWLKLIRFKKQNFSAQHLVFIIVPHHSRSTKLENHSKYRSSGTDLLTSNAQFLHKNLIPSNIDVKQENLSSKMSIAELLDTFYPSVAICSRKSHKKNVNKINDLRIWVLKKYLIYLLAFFTSPSVFFTSFSIVITQVNMFSQQQDFLRMQFSKTDQRGFL